MASKSCPDVYGCSCGNEQTGHNLQFCGHCGSEFNSMNGRHIFRYINKCDCCQGNITRRCNECGSFPIPMNSQDFIEYRQGMLDKYKDISETHDQISKLKKETSVKCDEIEKIRNITKPADRIRHDINVLNEKLKDCKISSKDVSLERAILHNIEHLVRSRGHGEDSD